MLDHTFLRGISTTGFPVLNTDADPSALSGAAALAYLAHDNVVTFPTTASSTPRQLAVAIVYQGVGSLPVTTVSVYAWEPVAELWFPVAGALLLPYVYGTELQVTVPDVPAGVKSGSYAIVVAATTPPTGTYAIFSGAVTSASGAGANVSTGATEATLAAAKAQAHTDAVAANASITSLRGYIGAEAPAQSDSVDLANFAAALYVGTGGALKYDTWNHLGAVGATRATITLANVPDGTTITEPILRVWTTGTQASSLKVMF